MRVLHLPYNIASQIQVTVEALRRLGVSARGLVCPVNRMQTNDGMELLPDVDGRLLRARGLPSRAYYWGLVLRALSWADVVHWHFAAL